ncbi:MAG: hypothetical protein JWO10_63 [Microbacteriaceae bacterium]|nr:hypothetical protein [Microbacteriaceae bacterium]
MSDREELHLLAGAYALGALDEAEREEFENYLLTSEEARAEVASLSDTAVMLGLATEPVAPSTALKASILARVAATPQLAPETAAQGSVAVVTPIEASRATFAAPRESSHVIREVSGSKASTRAQARWFARPATILAAAVAAIALFAGGTALGISNSQTGQSQQAASFGELSAASDVQRAEAKVAGGGDATVIWSVKQQRSAVLIDKLPALSADKTYELWYIDGSGATAAGTFNATKDGKTVKMLDGKMSRGDTVGVTVEPKGGSTRPSTDPILVVVTA